MPDFIQANDCNSRGMSQSQTFGLIALLVGLCSLFYGVTSNPGPALFVTQVTWGSIFVVVAIALFIYDRLF
jgi:hypothetical protein